MSVTGLSDFVSDPVSDSRLPEMRILAQAPQYACDRAAFFFSEIADNSVHGQSLPGLMRLFLGEPISPSAFLFVIARKARLFVGFWCRICAAFRKGRCYLALFCLRVKNRDHVFEVGDYGSFNIPRPCFIERTNKPRRKRAIVAYRLDSPLFPLANFHFDLPKRACQFMQTLDRLAVIICSADLFPPEPASSFRTSALLTSPVPSSGRQSQASIFLRLRSGPTMDPSPILRRFFCDGGASIERTDLPAPLLRTDSQPWPWIPSPGPEPGGRRRGRFRSGRPRGSSAGDQAGRPDRFNVENSRRKCQTEPRPRSNLAQTTNCGPSEWRFRFRRS